MLTLPVGDLVEVVGGKLVYGSEDTVVNGLAIDSRDVHPGAAFVAFVGQQVDGHSFVAEALAAGARALLLTRLDEEIIHAVESARRPDSSVVVIDDPVAVLGRLAAHHRNRLGCPVVGITGSTGKTTTKDLLEGVLGRSRRVVATEGNRNNEIGLPLTVLAAGVETEVLVLEMAMRGSGQIAELCKIARPTMGLVTNVGETHMELLGSQEAIADAKSELVAAVDEDGVAFLNGDDAWAGLMASRTHARIVTYGMGEACDVRASDVFVETDGRPVFALATPVGSIRPKLAVPGRHNVYNAAAAAAVALEIGVELEEIEQGLCETTLSPMRMELFSTAAGVTVINDAYNASPSSMRAAVSALLDLRVSGLSVAVLGDMAELGSLSELAHFKLGEEVGRSGVDRLVTVGPKALRIAEGARAVGMKPRSVASFEDTSEAADYVSGLSRPGDAVLVKASRVMGLEAVVERLMGTDVQA